MNTDITRDLGDQPLARVMAEHNLKPHDLVAASTEQLTHKMVSRAAKGRRLTVRAQAKILNALNTATKRRHSLRDLFTY